MEVQADTAGWLTKTLFQASAKNVGMDSAKIYQYEVGSPLTLFKENPAGSYDLKRPTGAERERLATKVAALPKRNRLEQEWLHLEGVPVETWTDNAGKTWLGVRVDTSQVVWFDSSASQRLSSAYDWLGWRFLQEQARPDDPTTRAVTENTFHKDGFCDLDSLLALTGAATFRGNLPGLRRFGFAHPSEWDYQPSASFDKWARLKQDPWNHDDHQYTQVTRYIQSLRWWADVPGLPAADGIWHVHPIGFIEHLRGMCRISASQLIEIFGSSYSTRMRNLIEPLCATLERYQITTPFRIAHFLAQVALESHVFDFPRELNPKDYQNSNGNIYPGDGKTFFGRGFIQLTGRVNYEKYEDDTGVDFTSSYERADAVAEGQWSFDSAGWYWNKHRLNTKADASSHLSDAESVKAISTVVNGGCNGLGMRVYHFKRAKYVLCRDIDG